jgi:hypothetical protein
MSEKTYRHWVCGKIDPRYDMALHGVSHAEADRCGHTLCGLQARTRETATTIWYVSEYGRETSSPTPSCKKCRKALGDTVNRWERSVEML